MKSKAKSKIIILITLGILFALLPINTTNLSYITDNSNKSLDYSNDFTLDKDNLKISAVSEKIHIDNNWTAAKAAGICTGEGTFSDPYIIKDLEIDAGGSDCGIEVIGSNVYFRIENCRVYNSGSEFYDAGIFLGQVSNGLLLNNDVSNNNKNGINLRYSDDNIITGNIVNDNTNTGIFLELSDDNTISGNTANNHNDYGILVYYSNNNNISGNTANNNEYGMLIAVTPFSRNNSIYLNCFNNNTLNAYDMGYPNNHWDDGNNGNYWDDYTGLDEDSNGIGDVPYNITGSAGSQDNFPLIKCPISAPSPEGGGIPIELIILISVISGGAAIGVATLLLIRRKRKRME
jgi:parallel beta-helix repeat protein